MTLFKQLILGVSLVFLVLLAGVEAIYLANARVQLQEQMGSQAQEAATTLAMRLAPLGSLEDTALIETLLNPVFDRGYFQEIRVLSTSGETVVRKVLPPAPGRRAGVVHAAVSDPRARRAVAGEFRLARAGPDRRGQPAAFRVRAALERRPADHRMAAARLRGGHRGGQRFSCDAAAAAARDRTGGHRDRRARFRDHRSAAARARTSRGWSSR